MNAQQARELSLKKQQEIQSKIMDEILVRANGGLTYCYVYHAIDIEVVNSLNAMGYVVVVDNNETRISW